MEGSSPPFSCSSFFCAYNRSHEKSTTVLEGSTSRMHAHAHHGGKTWLDKQALTVSEVSKTSRFRQVELQSLLHVVREFVESTVLLSSIVLNQPLSGMLSNICSVLHHRFQLSTQQSQVLIILPCVWVLKLAESKFCNCSALSHTAVGRQAKPLHYDMWHI